MGFVDKLFGLKKDGKEAKNQEVRDIGFQKVKEALLEEEKKVKFQEAKDVKLEDIKEVGPADVKEAMPEDLKEAKREETKEGKLEDTDKSLNGDREKDIEKENFMKKGAEYAISVFENYEANDNVLGLVNKIAEFTKDINLAWEFFWFIPAIYLRTVLNGPKYTDTVILVMPDNRNISGKLYDYKSYVIAVDVVLQSLQMKKSQEQIQKVLFLSEEFKALQQAISNGSKPEDLEAKPMVLMAPVNYVV